MCLWLGGHRSRVRYTVHNAARVPRHIECTAHACSNVHMYVCTQNSSDEAVGGLAVGSWQFAGAVIVPYV